MNTSTQFYTTHFISLGVGQCEHTIWVSDFACTLLIVSTARTCRWLTRPVLTLCRDCHWARSSAGTKSSHYQPNLRISARTATLVMSPTTTATRRRFVTWHNFVPWEVDLYFRARLDYVYTYNFFYSLIDCCRRNREERGRRRYCCSRRRREGWRRWGITCSSH